MSMCMNCGCRGHAGITCEHAMDKREIDRLRAQVAGKVREYDRGFTVASTVCDIEIQALRGLLREALDELEVFNPAGVSLQHKIRREIGGEK